MKQKTMHTKGCPICEKQENFWSESEARQAVPYIINFEKRLFATAKKVAKINSDPKSFENLEVGDSVWDENGNQSTILRKTTVYELEVDEVFTIEELKQMGLTLSPPDPVKELKTKIMKLIRSYK